MQKNDRTETREGHGASTVYRPPADMILFKVLTSPINLKQIVTSLQNVLKKAGDALGVERKETRKESVAKKKKRKEYSGLWVYLYKLLERE